MSENRNIARGVFSNYLTICLSLNSPEHKDKDLCAGTAYLGVDSSDHKWSGEKETRKEQDNISALMNWITSVSNWISILLEDL